MHTKYDYTFDNKYAILNESTMKYFNFEFILYNLMTEMTKNKKILNNHFLSIKRTIFSLNSIADVIYFKLHTDMQYKNLII